MCGGTEHCSPLDREELAERDGQESQKTHGAARQGRLHDQRPSRNHGTDFATVSSIFRKGCRIKAYIGSMLGDAVLLI